MLFFKKALVAAILLVLVSPLFGVVLADLVGYHEPLDLAAEAIGLEDLTESLNWTPLLDYSVPGLPAEVGYIVAGFVGIAIILGIGLLALKAVGEQRSQRA
ncbi:MAG: cobalamin biosynthesis protein [Thermoprotei archaeon]|nr:MAG: cobalamin biosynthesis protein [Thermoprotei archaeon]